MSFWSNQEIQFLKQSLHLSPQNRYQSYSRIFGLGRSADAVERQVRRIKNGKNIKSVFVPHVNETQEQEIPTELSSLLSESADLFPSDNGDEAMILKGFLGVCDKPSKREIHKEKEHLKAFVNSLVDATKNIKFKPVANTCRGSSFVICLSDTHIGKLTSTFNAKIFKERILSIPDKMISEITIPHDLTEIVVILAGDMLEGEDIYPTQAHHIEMNAIDQLKGATEAFWALGKKLYSIFQIPVRFVTCPGNHGRTSKTASEKTNWDNVIYQTLGFIAHTAQELGDDNIQVECNLESFHIAHVQDKRILINHHGTKHVGTAGMQAKIAGWIHTKKFDLLIHGHWHKWEVGTQFGKPIMKNGALPGGDDLAEQMGVYDPPRQGWFMVRKGLPISQLGFFEWTEELA